RYGHQIGYDLEVQLRRDALELRAVNGAHLQSPRTAGDRSKPAFDPISINMLRFRPAPLFQCPRGIGEWNARGGAREHGSPGRQRNDIGTSQQRLIRAAEI